MNFLSIGLFGLLGVYFRWWIDQAMLGLSKNFPFSTLLINSVGSFLIGLIYVLSQERHLLSESTRLTLSIGFCGGLTTFSAYTLQSVLFLDHKEKLLFLLYFVISPVMGLGCAFLGMCVARAFKF